MTSYKLSDFAYASQLMLRMGLDDEACSFFNSTAQTLLADGKFSAEVGEIVSMLAEKPEEYRTISDLCDALAEKSGINEHSITGFIFLAAAEKYHEKCLAKGITEEIFLDTMDDFRCKLLECREMHGVDGVFVREWLFLFHRMNRFALGRMQYELTCWYHDPVTVGGRTLFRGDPCVGFHIPSSGKPFDKAAREESYRLAKEFYETHPIFSEEFKKRGIKIAIVCSSWLLDPEFQRYLPKSSNIRDFAHDFDAVIGSKDEKFNDAWRVFGKASALPPEQLPEDTNLRKMIKYRLVNDRAFHHGRGIRWA